MKKALIASLLILTSCTLKTSELSSNNVEANIITDTIIEHWYVPDPQTALKIAEAVWLPIYGDEIYSSRPFNVSLCDSVWIVEGSLPDDMDGGVLHIEIKGINGTILKVYHGK